MPQSVSTPLDLFALLLGKRLAYKPGERDLVVLSHEIIARSRRAPEDEEVHTASLVAYGAAGASAMARTVGLPVAFAALHVLDGGVRTRGVHGPTDREVYAHILRRLEEAGLGMKETVRPKGQTSVEESLASRWKVINALP